MSDIEYDEQVKTKSRKKLKPPQSYKVLLHNDNYTTMEFVIFVLETVFSKSLSEATRIMLHVHNNGIGNISICYGRHLHRLLPPRGVASEIREAP